MTPIRTFRSITSTRADMLLLRQPSLAQSVVQSLALRQVGRIVGIGAVAVATHREARIESETGRELVLCLAELAFKLGSFVDAFKIDGKFKMSAKHGSFRPERGPK